MPNRCNSRPASASASRHHPVDGIHRLIALSQLEHRLSRSGDGRDERKTRRCTRLDDHGHLQRQDWIESEAGTRAIRLNGPDRIAVRSSTPDKPRSIGLTAQEPHLRIVQEHAVE